MNVFTKIKGEVTHPAMSSSRAVLDACDRFFCFGLITGRGPPSDEDRCPTPGEAPFDLISPHPYCPRVEGTDPLHLIRSDPEY